MRIRSLFVGVFVVVAMAALLAGPATAGSIHSDDMDAFEKTWFRHWNSTAGVAQEDGSVTLTGAEGSDLNRVVSREYLSTHNLTRVFLDRDLIRGGFELTAVKFGAVNGRSERIGIVSLGRNLGGAINLKGVDWGGAEEIRLRLVLDGGSELNIDRVDVHASAAPEPSAALLLGIGFLVTGARLRFRRPR